jgi:hypothetical protein
MLQGAGVPTFMLKPALALVSMKITPKSRDFESPSSIDTCLRYQKRTRPLKIWLVTWMDQHMPICMWNLDT